MRSAAKRSPVELIKENSQQLRGTLAEELAKDSDKFTDQDKQLIKFHGSYQQDNRDARKDRQKHDGRESRPSVSTSDRSPARTFCHGVLLRRGCGM